MELNDTDRKKIDMDTTIGNKLIAEFMGRKFNAYKGNYSFKKGFKTFDACEKWIKKENLPGYIPEIGWNLGCGKYHSSWDWLMPVVEKIEKTKAYIYHRFSFRIEDTYCGVGCHEENRQPGIIYQTPFGFDPETKINATWLAVVEFIKWYNTQPPISNNKRK